MNAKITDIVRNRVRGRSELLRESDRHMLVDRVSGRAFQHDLRRAEFVDTENVPIKSETVSLTKVFTELRPTHEQISFRAQERYEARMLSGIAGDALSDWIAAERDCWRESMTARHLLQSALNLTCASGKY